MTHSQRIKALQSKWRITRTLMAELISVPYVSLEQWENETRKPDAAAKAYICALCDDTVFERVTGLSKEFK